MALADIGRLIDGLRRVDRLFENVRKLQESQEALDERLLEVERRMTRFENREELLIEKMGTRASETATSILNANLVDMARRLGALEERSRMAEEGRLRLE